MGYVAKAIPIKGSALTAHGIVDNGTNSIVAIDHNWTLVDAQRIASVMNDAHWHTAIPLLALLREGALAERARIKEALLAEIDGPSLRVEVGSVAGDDLRLWIVPSQLVAVLDRICPTDPKE